MTYSIERIQPTLKNAESLIALTAEDLQRTHLPEAEIQLIADPANIGHRERQQNRLQNNPGLYMGAIASGEVVGFRKANEWFTGDQAPYADGLLERVALRMCAQFNHHHLHGRPLGIFALSVANRLGADEGVEIGRSLMDDLLANEAPGHSDVRIGLHDEDPLMPLLIDE